MLPSNEHLLLGDADIRSCLFKLGKIEICQFRQNETVLYAFALQPVLARRLSLNSAPSFVTWGLARSL